MQKIIIFVLLILASITYLTAGETQVNETLKVIPDSSAGFKWPYYLYIPTLPDENNNTITILVQPNNSGKCTDDYSVQDSSALRDVNRYRNFSDAMKVALLIPVFPRPEENWEIYTHALDRDAILTDNPELKRPDLQLMAMIEDARKRLKARSLTIDDKILMMGFSASGMFVNRFAVIHPEIVKGAAFGSPGGWPIAPLPDWNGEALRYPVGVSDLAEIAGTGFDSEAFAKVPMFLYLGDQDSNDAVDYDDGFNAVDREQIDRLFGETPVSRWPSIEKIYRQTNPECRLKLYDNAGHETTGDMWKDIKAFFIEIINGDR